jgi:hypothetical protein
MIHYSILEYVRLYRTNNVFVYDKCYESVAFFFAAYYNSHRYIEKARGAFGLRKVTDYT